MLIFQTAAILRLPATITVNVSPARLKEELSYNVLYPSNFSQTLRDMVIKSKIGKEGNKEIYAIDMKRFRKLFDELPIDQKMSGTIKNQMVFFSDVENLLSRLRVAEEASPPKQQKTRKGESGGENSFMRNVGAKSYWLLDWKKIAAFEADNQDDAVAKLFIAALLESKIGYYKDGNIIVRIEWDGSDVGLAEKFKAKLFQNGLVDHPDHADEIMSGYTKMLTDKGFKLGEFSEVPKEIH